MATDAKIGVFSTADLYPEGGKCLDANALSSESISNSFANCLGSVSRST